MRLEGKNALITGAGSGIGQAIAKLFVREGANVVVNDRYRENADSTLKSTLKSPDNCFSLVADVTDQASVENMINEVNQRLGHLDILVCNAGTTESTPFNKMSRNQWNEMLDIHLNGVYNCCRAVIDRMLERCYGRIVIVSSLSGIRGDPNLVHYSAAKAGQIGFARALAKETVSRGITVNLIAPGTTETPIFNQLDRNVLDDNIPPVGRFGTPEDQAWAVVYLSSDEAEFVTGQVISPAGGLF